MQRKAALLQEEQSLQNLAAQTLHLANGQAIWLARVFTRPGLVPLCLEVIREALLIGNQSERECVAHLIYEILEAAARVEGRDQAGIAVGAVAQETQVQHRVDVRMMQRSKQLHQYFPRALIGRQILEGHTVRWEWQQRKQAICAHLRKEGKWSWLTTSTGFNGSQLTDASLTKNQFLPCLEPISSRCAITS